MKPITKEEWNKRIAELPEDVQAIILNNDDKLSGEIEQICAKYQIDEMLAGSVARLTVKLLMGLIPPAEFVKSITETTGMEREKAVFIAQDINRGMLNSVKESLRKIHNIDLAVPQKQSVPPMSPPVAPAVAPSVPQMPPKEAPSVGAPAAPTPGILEQKLAGAFHAKTESVSYSDQKSPGSSTK